MTSQDTQTPTYRRSLAVNIIAYAVMLNALLIIASTLPKRRLFHHDIHINFGIVGPGITLFLGLSLLYLSFRLVKRKQTAWMISLGFYAVIVLVSLTRIIILGSSHFHGIISFRILSNLILPALIIVALLKYRDHFTVRSDIRSFGLSLRFVLLVFGVAFLYGVCGFLLLDKRDFHRQIGLGEAIHHTIDQFGLTTSSSLTPYTRQAKAFLASLSIISIGAVAYAIISFFQPIRMRFGEQSSNREKVHELLDRYPASSEDFFKLWPHDKLFYFNEAETAGLAYRVHHGIALVAGDPFGDREAFSDLLGRFDELCFTNDWSPAFVHTEPGFNDLYKSHDFSRQKIGEEAVLDIAKFKNETIKSKYFRQIKNKFEKQNYSTELLMPPHNSDILKRLHQVSDVWLAQPGRAERGFMMGYYSHKYMEACPVMVLKDGAGTIQAFINQILSFDKEEANFDLLRHTRETLGNSNDYLLMKFIDHINSQGFKRLNLGLCPLAGLKGQEVDRSVVDNALRFLYANGDRFYSFSGLHRFKAKYDPIWSGRYIAYRGGIGNFTRVLNALNRAMRV